MIPGSIRRFWPLWLMGAVLLLPACSPPEHVEAPSPRRSRRPSPSPTPLYVPYKRLEVGRLFSGVQLQTSFSTRARRSATSEIAIPSSYSLHLDLHVRIPHAVTTQEV